MRIKKHHTKKSFPWNSFWNNVSFSIYRWTFVFVNRKQYYKLNEFSRTVTFAGEFDLQILGAVCPRDGLLQQLRDFLNRIDSAITAVDILEEEDNEIVS